MTEDRSLPDSGGFTRLWRDGEHKPVPFDRLRAGSEQPVVRKLVLSLVERVEPSRRDGRQRTEYVTLRRTLRRVTFVLYNLFFAHSII
jgi:hypothetical protein